MKCKAKRTDGKPCQARAMQGSNYCFRHNPEVKSEALEASSRGGSAKRQYTKLGNAVRLETPHDIKKLMGKAINNLWTGKMPASNPAGSLGYLAKIFLESYEKSELESRLERLESRVKKAEKKDDGGIVIQFIASDGRWTDPEGYLLDKDEAREKREEYDKTGKIVILLNEFCEAKVKPPRALV
jgi:hypothetical protein